MITKRITLTADGTKTIYIPEIDEHYHSVNGAATESIHVYIEKGFLFSQAGNPTIFEAGFGTGLNCLLTAIYAEKEHRPVNYIAVEKYPLDQESAWQLNYGEPYGDVGKKLFQQIHELPWEKEMKITDFFSLQKICADIRELRYEILKPFDVVYYDAFGPDKQPEMWTQEIFTQISSQCSADSVFVTYSAKGEVRRRLTSAGYTMERLPGPPGKKEMLRGIKKQSKI
jgi:tRNA U34 5-methylaminomethyl-2-thiouridine-forming methyltransferase MnmC